MADLRERLEEHKKKTAVKKTRRAKWENWKKTQAMFYCKTSTNYSKWDMFESESDSDKEEEPIVNEEDPQIKAMAQDFKERHQRRVRSKKLAEELKKKGNDAMKRGLYKSAMHHYTQALEERKDYLALYTNRALVALKLEDAQQAIDDCSRVLEYCEVFHDGYQKEKDLCYKALLRRGLANKFQHDFDLAKADFEEAKKIEPEGVSEADKQLRLNEEERAHQKRLADIMANAESLKGKEYIDYLLAFLAGKMSKDIKNSEKEMKNKKKRKQLCFHELTVEEAKKLKETLDVENMVYYFSIQNGLPMLVDSLYISTNGLPLITSILETD
jgi:tetratricopeptide (TPR) repeat protein